MLLKLTHLGVALLACMASTDEGLEPWFHRTTNKGMQTLIWRFIPTEQINNVKLGCKR